VPVSRRCFPFHGAISPAALRGVESLVSAEMERIPIGRSYTFGAGNTNTNSELQVQSVTKLTAMARNRCAEAICHGYGQIGVTVGEDHAELLPADSREEVIRAQELLHTLSKSA
jgi:hypothetical protein